MHSDFLKQEKGRKNLMEKHISILCMPDVPRPFRNYNGVLLQDLTGK